MSFIASSRFRRRLPWSEPGIEPGLADVLTDPLVRLVMRRDGVTEAELRRVIAAAQVALWSRLCPCWAA